MVWEETILAAGTISDPNLCLHLSLLVQQVHFGHTEPTTVLQTQHEVSHPRLLPFCFIFFTSLEISPLFIHLIYTMSSNSSIISSEPLSPLYQSLFHSTVKIFVSFLFFFLKDRHQLKPQKSESLLQPGGVIFHWPQTIKYR